MSIVDNLKLIVNAQKGKDVRQAIHDGIQQCYADGKSGVIDLEARMLLEEKASVDDSNIKTTDTYSSNKIESLIANSNYKKAVLKQKITKDLNGGSAYISQISNIIFIDFVNCVVTGSSTNREWITYSTNIPAALYPVNKTINNVTLSINAGDRSIGISTTGGKVNGSIMFLAESSDNYTDETITDIQASLANVNELVDVINDIPLDYEVKNIAKPVKNLIGINNNLEYYVNYGTVKIKAGTVSDTLNFDLRVTEKQLIKAGTYTVTFFIENFDVDFYGQVRKVSKTGAIIETYVNGLAFSSGKRTYTFTIPEDGYYEIHILNYTTSYVLSKDITVKFMLDLGSTSAMNYKPYVENAQTRMLSLEAEVEELKSVILAMGANV